MGRLGSLAGVCAAVLALSAAPASAGAAPKSVLKSEDRLSALYAQGIARIDKGWILTGRFVIDRVNEKFKPIVDNRRPIPQNLLAQGYNHVGDIDVVGKYIYAPLEQGNYDLGHQITARYNLRTLKFIDYVVLPQHENSFVTVDPKTMIAYTMDHFDGNTILRYDVRKKWRVLAPLQMDMTLQHTQGGDVADGAIWIQSSDPQNSTWRVDLHTGHADLLGSSGHVPGEGEGIDATKLKSGRLHTLTVDPNINPVWLGHFAVVG